jgi:hypothetical protein
MAQCAFLALTAAVCGQAFTLADAETGLQWNAAKALMAGWCAAARSGDRGRLAMDWTIDENQPDYQSDYQIEDGIRPNDLGRIQTTAGVAVSGTPDEGPCLYLGPAGQRCYKRAIKDGFCAAHQPGVTTRAQVAKRSKIAAAIAGILGALWPYVYDFVHALLRLFHPR